MEGPPRPPPGGQKPLPWDHGESRDAAYLAAVDDLVAAGLPRGPAELLRWMIREGRPRGLARAAPPHTQRSLSALLGFSQSTICEARKTLKLSRLVYEVDGTYQLHLPWLVELAEEARSRRQTALAPDMALTAADALDVIGSDRQRSAMIGDDRQRSAPRPYRKKENLKTVSVPTRDPGSTETVTDTGASRSTDLCRSQPIATDQGLRESGPWQRLQTKHFRPEIDLTALRPAFYAAVQSGLIDDTHECKLRWLATVYDVAHDRRINSPAVVLRYRTEQRTCYRISEEGRRWAIGILRPAIQAKGG